ncbi:hypothetical protein J4760_04080 [Salinicoccus sp. ID82-1]|uniref:hypothetical protein n=1 Tax=Salinicoccus sp. ID82-1 TaxID=2820269 RepID=UPI001F48CFA5|nr:hypothetical protein [Salinicoccus sp. ID82-1]MCG1009230.1 hypothetical protein [Salinicoccus sp. ID82-1]
MFEQKRVTAKSGHEFLRNGVGVEFSTGNITLDASKFTAGTVVKGGTAVSKNTSTGLYELVTAPAEGEESARLNAPMLTRHTVTVEDTSKNVHVAALTKGNVIEALTTGATDQFKNSSNFFWY